MRGNSGSWASRAALFLLLVGAPCAVVILVPSDAAGWIVLYVAIFVALLYRPYRKSRSLFCLGVGGALLYAGAAILNAYFVTLPGGGADAATFLHLAKHYADGGFLSRSGGAEVFTVALGMVFSVFGKSELLAHALNSLAAVLTFPVLYGLRREIFGDENGGNGWLLVATLLPSAFLFRTAVLRESWQGLFFSLAVLGLLRCLRRLSVWNVALFVISGGLAAALHSAFAIFLMMAVAIFVGTSLGDRRRSVVQRMGAGVLLIAVLIPVGWLGYSFASADSRVRAFEAELASGEPAGAFDGVQRMDDGGATYGAAWGMMGGPIVRFVAGNIYYWVAPLPWQIRGLGDVWVLLENLVRLALLFGSVRVVRRVPGGQRRIIVAALLSVLAIETVWSMGTSNWGTAIRHHVPSLGVLCVLGFYGFGSASRC